MHMLRTKSSSPEFEEIDLAFPPRAFILVEEPSAPCEVDNEMAIESKQEVYYSRTKDKWRLNTV